MAAYKEILLDVFTKLGLTGASPLQIAQQLPNIVAELAIRNAADSINVTTTGRISEELCEAQLRAITATGGTYAKTPRNWKWIGDFFLYGAPVNTIISVKSFTAKERLLASATGSLLSPTIGWGLFEKPDEFKPDRLLQYRFKSFFAIYIPDKTYDAVSRDAKEVVNINARKLVRRHSAFVQDLQRAIVAGYVDPMEL